MFPSVFCAATGGSLGLVFIFLVSVTLSIVCAAAINKSSFYSGEAVPDPRPLGGGMILVAIVLIVRVIWMLITLMIMPQWMDDFWTRVAYNYSQYGTYESGVMLIYAEMLFAGVNIVGSIFMAYLFFKQRDIFPQVASWLFIGSSIIWLLDVGLGSYLVNRNVSPLYLVGFAGGLLMLAVFLYYINFSDRSRATFTVPHHSVIIEEY